MKRKLVLLPLMLSALLATAQPEGSHLPDQLSRIAEPNSVAGSILVKPEAKINPETFFSEFGEAFKLGPNDEMRLISNKTDKIGRTHYRFQQYHQGIPLEDGLAQLHAKAGKVYLIFGQPVEGIELATSPTMEQDEALTTLLASKRQTTFAWEVEDPYTSEPLLPYPEGTLVIAKQRHEGGDETHFLAYRYLVKTLAPVENAAYWYADAHTGELRATRNLTNHACNNNCTNNGTTNTIFYGNNQSISVFQNGSNFELIDNCRDFSTRIAPGNGPSDLYTHSTSHFNGINFQGSDLIGGSAHWAMTQAYDFFCQEYDARACGPGSPGQSQSHITLLTEWSNNNASWALCTIQVSGDIPQGSPNGPSDDWVSIDLIAHEYTHGVIELETMGLPVASSDPDEFEGSSINEAIGDMMGTAVEHAVQGGTSDFDYRFGEDFKPNPATEELRRLDHPTYATYPALAAATLNSDDWHIAAGVADRWFYLLADGDVDPSTTPTWCIKGIGIEKATDIVFHSLPYLNLLTDYNDFRDKTIQSAIDRFGAGSYEVYQTIMAWDIVQVAGSTTSGMTATLSPGFSITSTPPFCTGQDVFVQPNWVDPDLQHNWYFNQTGSQQGTPDCSGANCSFAPQQAGGYSIIHVISSMECPAQTAFEDQSILTTQSPVVTLDDANFCNDNLLGDLTYQPSDGIFSGSYLHKPSTDWKFNAYLAGPGTHQIQIEKTEAGCTNSATATIAVDDPMAGNFTTPTTDLCEGDDFTFAVSTTNSYSHAPTYTWTFPSGTSFMSNNALETVTFATQGGPTVLFTGENACTTAPLQQAFPITISDDFTTLDITSGPEICGNQALTTNYTGTDNINWSGPIHPTTGVVNVPTLDQTTGSITATIANACGNSITENFDIFKPKPVVPSTVCEDWTSATLTADLATGIWDDAPNGQYPQPLPGLSSGGSFAPGGLSGEFRVHHQSACNTFGIVKILQGALSGQPWPKHFGGNMNEIGEDIAYDGTDSYYLTGTFSGSMTVGGTTLTSVGGTDIYLVRYTDCGLDWVRSFGSILDESTPAVTVDRDNNTLFLSATLAGPTNLPGGTTLTPGSGQKGFVAKFDTESGEEIWAVLPDNTASLQNQFRDIDAVDGFIAVTGNYLNQINIGSTYQAAGGTADRDIITISLADAGQSWTNLAGHSYGSMNEDVGNGVAIMPGMLDIYVTGAVWANGLQPVGGSMPYIPQNPGNTEFFIGKYDALMNMGFALVYGGSMDDEGLDIDVDGSIFAAGYVEGNVDLLGTGISTNNGSRDAFIAAVQPSAMLSWYHTGGGPGLLNPDRASAISVENSVVYVAGEYHGNATFGGFPGFLTASSATDRDVFVATYASGNGQAGTLQPAHGPGSVDMVHAITANGMDEAYLTGSFSSTLDLNTTLNVGTGTDMYAARFSLAQNAFYKTEVAIDTPSTSIMVYPNPTRGEINVEFSDRLDRLEVWSTDGRLIEQRMNLSGGRVVLDLSRSAKGLYLIRAVSGGRIEDQKIILH